MQTATNAPLFGTVARSKFDEWQHFNRVQAALAELELALEAAADFSTAMPQNYSALLDTVRDAVHDECVTHEGLESRLEEVE